MTRCLCDSSHRESSEERRATVVAIRRGSRSDNRRKRSMRGRSMRNVLAGLLKLAMLGGARAELPQEALYAIYLCDFDEAYNLIRQPADSGDPDAQYLLGRMYDNGDGVPPHRLTLLNQITTLRHSTNLPIPECYTTQRSDSPSETRPSEGPPQKHAHPQLQRALHSASTTSQVDNPQASHARTTPRGGGKGGEPNHKVQTPTV